MKNILLLPFILFFILFTSQEVSAQDCNVKSDSIVTSGGLTELTICAGDSISDAFDVIVSDSAIGENRAWVITDTAGIILALPEGPTFDLEGAGIGVCLIWYLTFDSIIIGAEEGMNASNIQGCYDLSNPITVTRTSQPEAGTITTMTGATELQICAGDGVSDAFDAVNLGATGEKFAWVITDTSANILGLPDGPTFDLEGAGEGVCLLWYLSYNGNLQNAAVGNNVSQVVGCYDLSNSITVIRMGVNAGMITTEDSLTELTICAGDSISDAFDVLISGDIDGDTTGWVITDPDGKILGLPAGPPFDLEGAGEGTCLIWHLAYNGVLNGVAVDSNANNIQGCFALSNPITVTRVTQPEAGTIATTEGDTALTICAGDGQSDAFEAVNNGATGENFAWVITDPDGNILGLPEGPTFDLEGAGSGTCLLWYLSHNGDLQNVAIGNNVSQVVGCYALSNPITVTRNGVDAGTISTTDSLTELTICAGDGVSDEFDVLVSGDLDGDSTGWVITDPDGKILGLPDAPPFDLEEAGEGTCLVWHLAYNGVITGVAIDSNANNIQGCFDLSNPITVTRVSKPEAGTIATAEGDTAFTICAGDGASDAFEAVNTGATGENFDWVITDPDGNILGLPDGPIFDLEGAGTGTCLVWYYSFNGELGNVVVGNNVSMILGCYDVSNPITVTRNGVNAGTIAIDGGGTETNICAGDGVSDAFDVTMTDDTEGESFAWVITDPDGNILGLPEGPPFDLEEAGTGTCLVWHLAYNGEITGVEVGQNANNLEGCYVLSNPITVTRNGAHGGSIELEDGGTEISICAGDGVSDAFNVSLTDDIDGEAFGWVITDPDGNILGLPEGPPFDLEGAGEGTCLIWHLAYSGELTGAEIGQNANDLQGCFDLSNAITVTRSGVFAGSITTSDSTTELSICAGDGMSDAFDVIISGDIQGDSTAWIITDPDGNILGLPEGPPFDLEGAGTGTCLVWHVAYNGTLMGAEVGSNASDLEGCYALSNPITVSRSGANGGSIEIEGGGTELTICAGDGSSDAFNVSVSDDIDGEFFSWVITDPDGNILGLPEGPPFDLEGAGTGTCLVWHLAYSGDLGGAEIGLNANDLQGCWDLSNPITVTRNGVNAGSISTNGVTSLTICADDGESDAFNVVVSDDAEGESSAWVITDAAGNILALPTGPPFDLEGAGAGTCLVWYLRYSGTLEGAEVGLNASDLEGCFDLSNPITVTRRTGVGCGSTGDLVLEHGMISVGGSWTTVGLNNMYNSPVVVATVHSPGLYSRPVVTRVRNASGNSFELKVQNPGGEVKESYKVSYTVVEEGVYTKDQHGINMEAFKVNSSLTSSKARWKTEGQSPNNMYDKPIVLGQVMTYNDEDWSVFWSSRRGVRMLAPKGNNIAGGKHVGEDRDRSRADETIGMIIIEEGTYKLDGKYLQAGMGYTIIQGIQTNPDGSTYTTKLEGITNAVASSAGMRSRDGGWPVFVGDDPFADDKVRMAIDEDQIRDKERKHIGSNVMYLAFGEDRAVNTGKQKWNNTSPEESPVTLQSSNQQLNLFPNPVKSQLNLNIVMDEQRNVEIRLINVMGQSVLIQKDELAKGVNRKSLQIGNIPNGVYSVQITSNNQLFAAKKLIVQK